MGDDRRESDLAIGSRQYVSPPFLEAVCDVAFLPGKRWDGAEPGLLFAAVRNEFPERRPAITFSQSITEPEEGHVNVQVTPTERLQFWTLDGDAAIQVSKDHLAVNRLRPYPGWPRYRAAILAAVEQYREVANPTGLRRLSLHYINTFRIPERAFDLAKYLGVYPWINGDIEGSFLDFALTGHFLFDRHAENVLRLRLTDLEPEPEASLFRLDLSCVRDDAGNVGFEGLDGWLDNAHDLIEQTFEASITQELRSIFDAEG